MSPKPPYFSTPTELAFAAGRGSLARDAERHEDQTQQRVVNATLGGTSPPPSDGPEIDLDALGPADLAYLAGRGRVALNAELAQDAAAERIVNATRGGVHPDPYGEITDYAWIDGDRVVYDERGGHEYIPADEDE